jgi:hypothetical protein
MVSGRAVSGFAPETIVIIFRTIMDGIQILAVGHRSDIYR